MLLNFIIILRSEECSDGAKAGGTFLNEDHYVHHEDESDDNLSDLDDEIKQYIATDKEVNNSNIIMRLRCNSSHCLT